MHYRLLLSSYYIEVCVILFDNVLRPHVPVHLLRLVVAAQGLTSARLLVRMAHGVVPDAKSILIYPFELRLFSICTF